MRAVAKIVYTYAELSIDAKRRACDEYREATAGENDFAEFVTDEFKGLLRQCGFTVKADDITWSGFSCQGDGAAFSGYWNAEGCKPQAWLDERPPTCDSNKAWHAAVLPLIALAAAYPHASATICKGHNYMTLGEYDFVPLDAGVDHTADSWREHDRANDAAGDMLLTAVRGLASTFYRALEVDFNWAQADDQIGETLIANDYEFTIDGRMYQE